MPDVAANVPPVAYAGPDQDVNAGATVTLDGSGSSDSDGTIVGYSWTQTGRTTVTLANASTANPTFTAPNISETLTFELTVTNDRGVTATDFVYVNVFQANKPPVAEAGPDQTVDEGVTVTLNGSNSSDPDDGIKSYQWVQTEGPAVNLPDPALDKPTFVSPDVGSDGAALTFELTVTDKGDRTSTDTCIVNVSWINETPTADAGPDQSVNEGTTVKLNGINSSDPDNGLQSYEWKQVQVDGITVSLTDATTVEASFTTPSVAATGAKLTFELTVTDMGGLKATDTCIVNIGSVNAAPVADAGLDQTVSSGDSVTLDGSKSSDPDGGISGYLWKQIDGPQVKLNNPPPERPTFIAPQVSEGKAALTFELTVTDSAGQPASDTAVVTVLAVGDPTEPEQPSVEPSIDGVLARIRTLLDDPGIPEEVRQRLERVKNQLERASGYWQNDRSDRALRIVTRCAKNLRIAAKMTKGVPQLQEELSAIIIDLKNMVRAPAEAPAPLREDDSDENSSRIGDDDEGGGKDSDDHEDDEDDERSERNVRNAWRSYLSEFFRR